MDTTNDDFLNSSPTLDQPYPVLEIHAHLEYSQDPWYQDKIYAISDGGADSCILGEYCKVVEHTGRYANLVGYHPETTKSSKIPIVNGLIKVRSSTTGNYPVFLRINEAPYYKNSPITLLSEYKIRDYGLVIDSVATKHQINFVNQVLNDLN